MVHVSIPIRNGETVISARDLGIFAKYTGKNGCTRVLKPRKWYVNGGYALSRNTCKGPLISLARLIMQPPKGLVVDHINGDKLDNTRENLRICTYSENNKNNYKRREGKLSEWTKWRERYEDQNNPHFKHQRSRS